MMEVGNATYGRSLPPIPILPGMLVHGFAALNSQAHTICVPPFAGGREEAMQKALANARVAYFRLFQLRKI